MTRLWEERERIAQAVLGERRWEPPTEEASSASAADVGTPMSYSDVQAVTMNPAYMGHKL